MFQILLFRKVKAQVPLFKDFIFTKLEGFGGVCLGGSRFSRRTRISREKLDFLDKNKHKKKRMLRFAVHSLLFSGGCYRPTRELTK